jgi:hypothetical protein
MHLQSIEELLSAVWTEYESVPSLWLEIMSALVAI